MSKRPASDVPFTPEQYDSHWSHDELAARYLNLCTEYGNLYTQINRAGHARPFERERTIHNLLNARLRLESENQRLHRLNQDLQHANQTNCNIDEEVQKRLADTEASLRAVLEAQPEQHAGELREYQERVATLEKENDDLRKQLQNWHQSRKEFANDSPERGKTEESLEIELDDMEKRIRKLMCKDNEFTSRDESPAKETSEFEHLLKWDQENVDDK